MAGTVAMGLKPRRTSGQTSIPLWAGPESASHASAKGALLIFSSGYLDLASADVTSGIVGVAQTAGHNDGSAGTHQLEYVPALPGMRFEGTLEDETNNNHALVATNLGLKYAMQLDSTNDRWYVDENDTTNVSVLITKLIDDVTTVKGRVEFIFIQTKTIFSA